MRLFEKRDIQTIMEQCHKTQSRTNAIVSFVHEKNNIKKDWSDVYVAVKDNISVKGTPCMAGSKILNGYIPLYDATVVKKLKEKGAQILCKTNMDELGMGATGQNSCCGPTFNPYDVQRISGGSSSGSAVLVATDCVPLALATDTGDSIRVPASYNGVVGFKPTYGRISRYGVISYASSMDTVGFMTTCIEDAWRAFELLQGYDPNDMTSIDHSLGSINFSQSIQGKKIGILKNALDQVTDPELKKKFYDLMNDLRRQGAILQEVKYPQELMDLVLPVYQVISNSEACSNFAHLDGIRFGLQKSGLNYKEAITQSRTEGFSFPVKRRLLLGAYSLYEENQHRIYQKAQKIRRLLVDEFQKLFDDLEFLACLTTTDIAPKIEEEFIDPSYLKLANLSGFPALSLPFGSKIGCPYGLHLFAGAFQDEKMIEIAYQIEKIIDDKENLS